MKPSRTGQITLALALGLGLLGLGCSSSSPSTASTSSAPQGGTTPPGTTPAPGGSDTSSAMVTPAVQYDFYVPASEEALKADTNYGYLIAKTGPQFREGYFATQGLEVKGTLELKGNKYYYLYRDSDVMGALDTLKKTSGVIFAEPDLLNKVDGGITWSNPDPRALSEEYSLFITQCKDAWTTYGFGPNRPTSVDIDTGVNFGHEDLSEVVKHAFSWYSPTTSTTAMAAYSTPIDIIGTAQTSSDGAGHGSHTAGTIAAVGNNGKGVAGVCWQTDLVSYKGLSDAGSGGTWAIYGSLYHLLEWRKTNYTHTIPVNMSLGGTAASNFALDMVQACLENNIVIIASMGNSGENLIQYPSGYAGVIAVGATNGVDKKVGFSTLGRNISVVAPGFNIISTGNTGTSTYVSMSGTSMSTPFVTGLVTYMLTFAPDLNAAQIKTYLEANTDRVEGSTGYNEATGWGRVNVLKTIGAVVADVNAGRTPASNYINAKLKVSVTNTYQGSTTYYANAPVYLYNCDATGTVTNYVCSAITINGSISNGDNGVCFFNLLRPGYYVAKTNLFGNVGTTPVFQVTAGMTSIPDQTIGFNLQPYQIQTLPDAGSTGSEDNILKVWNQLGILVQSYDVGNLDSFTLLCSPQTYKLGVTPYLPATVGQYALFVSKNAYGATTAPGSFASPAPEAQLGSQSHTASAPQAISLDTLYNCTLTTAGDYYSFIVP